MVADAPVNDLSIAWTFPVREAALMGLRAAAGLTLSPEPTDQGRIVGSVDSVAWLTTFMRLDRDPRQEARDTV